MEKKSKFLIGALLIVGAIAYLIYTGVKETSVYYLTIEEFLPKREALANEGVRVAGRVQAGTLAWDPKDLNLRFSLGHFEDGEESLPVYYRGILPDMFAEGRDVIVEGKYSPGGVFVADTIMTSCPSKYESQVAAGKTEAGVK